MANSWEDSTGAGEYVSSVKQLLLDPVAFFDGINEQNDLSRSLVFALISFVIAAIAEVVWGVLWNVFATLPMLAANRNDQTAALTQGMFGTAFQVTFGILLPVLGMIGIFINSGLTHLFLLLFGSGKGGYLKTVKCYLYGTAPNFIFIVPCCGGLIAGIWSMVISIVGMTRIHKTGVWPVIAAVFVPMLICCSCIAIIIAIVISMGLASAPELLEQLRNMKHGGVI